MNFRVTFDILVDLLTGRIFRDIRSDEILPYTLWALRESFWLWFSLLVIGAILILRH